MLIDNRMEDIVLRKQHRKVAGILICSMALSVLSMTGCGNRYTSAKNDDTSLVVTIGKEKVYMDRIKPFIAKTEVTTEYYNQMYMQYNAEYNIWDEKDADGEKNSVSLRDDVLEEFEEKFIVYKEAAKNKDAKYEISKEDLKKLEKNSKELLKTFSKNVIKKTGFTEDSFVELQKMQYVYDKYKADMIKTFKVKKADVEKDYDYGNVYRQYKTTNMYISLSGTDEEGNPIELSDKEKKEAKKTLEKAYKLLKKGEKPDAIKEKYPDIVVEEKNYQQDEAYPADAEDKKEDKDKKSEDKDAEASQATEADAYIEKTKKLKNGKFTNVFEYDGKYCIGIMNNNKSKEAYDAAVESGVAQLEEDKFADKIKELKETDEYKITVNKKVWESVKLGNITIIQDEFLKASGILVDKNSEEQ